MNEMAVNGSSDAQFLQRYSRQTAFPGIGRDGQRRLAAARALLIGSGALGTAIAEMLVRAGLGFLRIVDRDRVELSNLPRQSLFDERDAADAMPKAAAAAKRLRQINSSAEIEPLCADVQPDSITGLLEGIDLVLDGTDNIEARYVINRACARAGVPWIYGGVIQAAGMSMTVLPGDTPCFRCVFPEQPPPGSSVTCATAGVIVPAVHVTAAVEVSEALKLLTGQRQLVRRGLFCFDMWRGIWETEALLDEPDPNCPDCSARNG